MKHMPLVILKYFLSLGFRKLITIDRLREVCPLLDMVDHDRRPKALVSIQLTVHNLSLHIFFMLA